MIECDECKGKFKGQHGLRIHKHYAHNPNKPVRVRRSPKKDNLVALKELQKQIPNRCHFCPECGTNLDMVNMALAATVTTV